MLGKIFIKDLHIQAKVGHGIHERQVSQNIVINVAVWADVDEAIETEDLTSTVNYHDIQNEIIELASASEFVLIERMANTILDICLKYPRVEKAWIRLDKPHKFPESDSVGIEMEKTK